MTLTFIDVVFSIIVLLFAVIAAAHGFIKELFSKLAVILGIVVAVSFFGKLAPFIEQVIHNKAVATVVAFLLLFIATYLLVKIVQQLVGAAFRGEILRGLDRTLGFVFGALEGIVVVSIVLILVNAQPWFPRMAESVTDGSFYWKVLGGILDQPISYVRGMLV
ncbi:MAG: CvpA family protein [Treponema sp.]|nr:CvpA family protein [Treponema sp.]